MEWFRDRAQGGSVTAASDGPGSVRRPPRSISQRPARSRFDMQMIRRPLPMLVLLALIWGSSFMFIKVAVRDLAPATLILGRIGLAALVLAVVVPGARRRQETLAELRAHWRWLVVVGLLNTAVPFWLLSWGETRVDSGLASIIQASVPIFNALLAFGFFHDQRVDGTAARRACSSASPAWRCSSVRSRRARSSARSPSSAWPPVTRRAGCSSGATSARRDRRSSPSARRRWRPCSCCRPVWPRRPRASPAGRRSVASSCSA